MAPVMSHLMSPRFVAVLCQRLLELVQERLSGAQFTKKAFIFPMGPCTCLSLYMYIHIYNMVSAWAFKGFLYQFVFRVQVLKASAHQSRQTVKPDSDVESCILELGLRGPYWVPPLAILLFWGPHLVSSKCLLVFKIPESHGPKPQDPGKVRFAPSNIRHTDFHAPVPTPAIAQASILCRSPQLLPSPWTQN